MLANFLEKSKPINFVVYLSFFFAFFLLEIYHLFFVSTFLLEHMLTSLVFLGSFFVIFFFVNFILSKNNLTFDNTFAYFLFTLFAAVFIVNMLNYRLLFCLLVYFLLLRKIYSLQKKNNPIQKLFDAGLWLGLLVFLQPESIIYVLLIYTAVLGYKIVNIKTILAPLTGLFVPLFLIFSYFFYVEKTADFFRIFTNIQFNFHLNSNLEDSWLIIFITVLSSVAFLIKTPKTMAVSNTFRKSWILININYLLAFILVILSDFSNKLYVVFLFFPASVVIANGFELIYKKTIQSIIFLAITVFVIFGKFFFGA